MQAFIRSILNNKKWYAAIYLLVTFHAAGIIGITNENSRELFLRLTPLSLIFSALVVAWFHREWNTQFILFLLPAYLIGVSVEILGVNTGFPFGNYEYGSSLGIKVYGTPLLIGLNWVLLIYCTGSLAEKVTNSLPLKILLASSLMVFIDCWMEPVAPVMDMWSFENQLVPLKNYVAWLAVSLLLHTLFFRLRFAKSNSIAVSYCVIITLFFVTLYFLLL